MAEIYDTFIENTINIISYQLNRWTKFVKKFDKDCCESGGECDMILGKDIID